MELSLLRSRGFGLILAALVVLLAFAFVVARSGPLAPTRVTVTKVGEGRIEPALFGIGTSEAQRAYLIGPTTAGRVLRVLVDVGDTVKSGQLLAEWIPSISTSASLHSKRRWPAPAVPSPPAKHKTRRPGPQPVGSDQCAPLQGSRRQEIRQQQRRRIQAAGRDFNAGRRPRSRCQPSCGKTGYSPPERRTRWPAPAARQSSPVSPRRWPRHGTRRGTRVHRRGGSGGAAGSIEPRSVLDQRAPGPGPFGWAAVGLTAEIALRSNPLATVPGKVARLEPVSDSVTEERIAQIAFDSLPEDISLGEMAEVTLRLPAKEARSWYPTPASNATASRRGVWLYRSGQSAIRGGHTWQDQPRRAG